MSYNAAENRIPHSGDVKLSDLRSATGNGSYVAGAILTDSGGTTDYLNKWAKFKQYVYSTDVGNSRYTDANSPRLAAAKASGWGFYNGIPSYANYSALLAEASGKVWTYNKVGTTTPFRFGDMLGYRGKAGLEQEWGLSRSDARNLYFPFGGYICLTTDQAGPYDAVKWGSIDPTDPDGNSSTGLLYPSDFDNMPSGTPSLYDWHFGLLLRNAYSNDMYLVTDSYTIRQRVANNDYPLFENLALRGGGNFPTGSYLIYPVLTTLHYSSGWTTLNTSWSNENNGPGRLAYIDGYSLPFGYDNTKNALSLTYTVSGSTINIRLTNGTPYAATISQMFVYLTSEANFDSSLYPEYVLPAIQEWFDLGTVYTGGIYNGSTLVAEYINIGGATVPANSYQDFTLTAAGTYNQYAFVDLLAQHNINGVTEKRNY